MVAEPFHTINGDLLKSLQSTRLCIFCIIKVTEYKKKKHISDREQKRQKTFNRKSK